MHVTIYSTQDCHYCKKAKEWLDRKGVAYEVRMVDQDPEAQREMLEVSGSFSVPVVVIEGSVIYGFEPLAMAEKLGLA